MNPGQKGSQQRSLSETLGLKKREMIGLTGAGGKTTLMFRLAKELILERKRVILTTTTKILEPSEEESLHLFVSRDEEEMLKFVADSLETYRQITLARERIGGTKLKGISPEFADTLWSSYDIDVMIIEADGAAGRPVKAPREREPVIPSRTTLVVGVLGLDGIGKELNDQNIFQASLVSHLTGIPLDEKITEEGMALLMIHPRGLFKGAPDSSRRIAFLNKVDVFEGLAKGREIARYIFKEKVAKIERVILGHLKADPAVVEVIDP